MASVEVGQKVALVTGASRGIGREVARQLAERGYAVILTARDRDKAAAAAQSSVPAETGRPEVGDECV